ncbi:MAG: hypothetical protein M1834_008596 [Cirrosporium novae-zelandiae]|nr:MAG: hypothetical protein M1834_008596 [Cirrosporium novae-zelandiae]
MNGQPLLNSPANFGFSQQYNGAPYSHGAAQAQHFASKAQGYHQGPGSNNVNGNRFDMIAMTSAFGNVNLQGHRLAGPGKFPVTGSPTSGAFSFGQANGLYQVLPNGQVVSTGMQPSPLTAQVHPSSYRLNYGQMLPSTPQAQAWSHPSSMEVPDLSAPRRGSWSSNEEAGPGTPFFGAPGHADVYPAVAVPEYSPLNRFSFSTPSPQQVSEPCFTAPLLRNTNGEYELVDLDELARRDPPIPRAIPALFTDSKRSLQKALHNEGGKCNVYIRGFPPNTTDEMLHAWASRFGEITRCKSIIDKNTGQCKGFGFVEYHNFIDSENCIRGFFHLGYETSYAQESKNSKLKDLADESSTNLYITGLPRDMNESMLNAVFVEYKIVSSKILRDQETGISRGVGFCRFENRKVCEEVLERFQDTPIGEEGNIMSLRYSDTPEQKELKKKTNERRQFRAHEYEASINFVNTQGQVSPGQPLLPYHQHAMANHPITYTSPDAKATTRLESLSNQITGTWQAPALSTPLQVQPRYNAITIRKPVSENASAAASDCGRSNPEAAGIKNELLTPKKDKSASKSSTPIKSRT